MSQRDRFDGESNTSRSREGADDNAYEERYVEPRREHSFTRTLIDVIVIIAVAILLTWGVRSFVMQPFEIPSGSMEDTIEIGDRVFSERVSYYFSDIQQGDIITFTDPTNSNQTLIKRVIARGGQTVDLIDGAVYVDGVALDEPYTEGKVSDPLPTTYQGQTISYPYTVPTGYLWVMGDNRTNSSDSRYFGAIPESSVSGHAFFVYWPLSHVGALN